ncbi:MAG: exonuclease SbcCD subunit D [Spirochaetales bacterium]|uniref:Nuclease SbcCD subunit D n=1 Tax=Candidatus Thalassospirochaeta sargassi TaxID=3119039 RepID=A0AAJ1IDE2_9SPIO|nr:exonuclease SbcCD subunit D [Spirochaetales bacterium]
MKFLHTSDWHLGARLGEYSRTAEQRLVLEEINSAADKLEAEFVIIAGDIFDNFNPPNEAVELLYKELKKLADDGRRPVIVIAGNHDSPDRIEAPDPLAAECGIFFIGYPGFMRTGVELECGTTVNFPEQGIVTIDMPEKPQVRILTTPYANENRLRKQLDAENREEMISAILGERWGSLAEKYCDNKGVNILTAHLFMSADSDAGELFAEADSPPPEGGSAWGEPDEERSILHPGGLELIDAAVLPPQIQYTALGHLHRPQTVRKGRSPVVYSGSPLAFGLSEENQRKSVVLIELEPGGIAAIHREPLDSGKRILRKTFPGVDEAIDWLSDNPDVYVELIIECDSYISAADRGRLYDSHRGITAIIPSGRMQDGKQGGVERSAPDLTDSMEDLFKSFFEYSKGVQPDDRIIELFREVAALGDEADAEASE